MSKRIRRREYGSDKEFKLYSDDRDPVPRVIQRISGETGEQMVDRGEAIRVERDGALLAYQKCIPAAHPKPVVMRTSPPTCAAFSRAEVEAIVGLRGRSRTAHLSAVDRAKRVLSGRSEEDLVETARNKFAVYKKTH